RPPLAAGDRHQDGNEGNRPSQSEEVGHRQSPKWFSSVVHGRATIEVRSGHAVLMVVPAAGPISNDQVGFSLRCSWYSPSGTVGLATKKDIGPNDPLFPVSGR